MNPKSEKSLDKIRRKLEERNDHVRLMRAEEVMDQFILCKRRLNLIANECGARRVMNKRLYIDMNIFEPYFKENYVKEDEK